MKKLVVKLLILQEKGLKNWVEEELVTGAARVTRIKQMRFFASSVFILTFWF